MVLFPFIIKNSDVFLSCAIYIGPSLISVGNLDTFTFMPQYQCFNTSTSTLVAQQLCFNNSALIVMPWHLNFNTSTFHIGAFLISTKNIDIFNTGASTLVLQQQCFNAGTLTSVFFTVMIFRFIQKSMIFFIHVRFVAVLFSPV